MVSRRRSWTESLQRLLVAIALKRGVIDTNMQFVVDNDLQDRRPREDDIVDHTALAELSFQAEVPHVGARTSLFGKVSSTSPSVYMSP